jgi:hypothetical protein
MSSTRVEFDEKKFWIALFSIMAQREAENANAISESFVPFVSSCGERLIPNGYKKRANPQGISIFL